MDNVENYALTDQLEHSLRHWLYHAELEVDLPVVFPVSPVLGHHSEPSQDGCDGSVLGVDTADRQQ